MADLTLADLDRIDALHAKATQDRWETDGSYDLYVFAVPKGAGAMIADRNVEYDEDAPPHSIVRARGTGAGRSDAEQAANMRSVAALHNAWPSVSAQLRRALTPVTMPAPPMQFEDDDAPPVESPGLVFGEPNELGVRTAYTPDGHVYFAGSIGWRHDNDGFRTDSELESIAAASAHNAARLARQRTASEGPKQGA